MIAGLLSLLGTVADGVGLFSGITSIIRGNEISQHLNRIESSLEGISLCVEKLADHILYVTNHCAVRNVGLSQQQPLTDLERATYFLKPLQEALRQDLLASTIIPTPAKLIRAIGESPFDLLLDTRPVHRAVWYPNMVPIVFTDNGYPYLGWQSRRGLEHMFDVGCSELWLPPSSKETLGQSAIHGGAPPNIETYQKFICPGCGKESTAETGVLCPKCDSFVHNRCMRKGEKLRTRINPLMWSEVRRTYLYACPVCGAVLATRTTEHMLFETD